MAEMFVFVRKQRKANYQDILGPYNKEGVNRLLKTHSYKEYDVFTLGPKVSLTEVPVVTTTYKTILE